MAERPFRIEVNVRTGERKQIPLTDAEIAERDAAAVVARAEQAKRDAEEAKRTARQAKLDALLDKIEADPTILDRL